jgi:hypothetical protein
LDENDLRFVMIFLEKIMLIGSDDHSTLAINYHYERDNVYRSYVVKPQARIFLLEIECEEKILSIIGKIAIDDANKELIKKTYFDMVKSEKIGDFQRAIEYMNDVIEQIIRTHLGLTGTHNINIENLHSTRKIDDFEKNELLNINKIRNARHEYKDWTKYVTETRYRLYLEFLNKIIEKLIHP